MGKQWKQCQTLFLGAPKSLQMVIAAMKLKDACSLEIGRASCRERVETVTDFFWAAKSLQMVIAAMKLIDIYSLEGKL